MRLLAALLMGLAAPALAETPPPGLARPGAVALYLQAMSLADLGARAQDPLLVLAAVRILHGLSLVDTPREVDPPAPIAAFDPLDAEALLDLARKIDAGGLRADLIDELARELPPPPKTLRATAARLGPGQSQSWTLGFFGGEVAELAVIGQGSTQLDTLVRSGKDTQICLEKGSATASLCSFVLQENGEVTVTVTNPDTVDAPYLLVTE